MGVGSRVGLKLYEVFMELVISLVEQDVGYPFAFSIQFVDRESVANERVQLGL